MVMSIYQTQMDVCSPFVRSAVQFASFLPVLPIKILGELKKSGLSLGSNKYKFLDLWVDILKGCGVDGD